MFRLVLQYILHISNEIAQVPLAYQACKLLLAAAVSKASLVFHAFGNLLSIFSISRALDRMVKGSQATENRQSRWQGTEADKTFTVSPVLSYSEILI